MSSLLSWFVLVECGDVLEEESHAAKKIRVFCRCFVLLDSNSILSFSLSVCLSVSVSVSVSLCPLH